MMRYFFSLFSPLICLLFCSLNKQELENSQGIVRSYIYQIADERQLDCLNVQSRVEGEKIISFILEMESHKTHNLEEARVVLVECVDELLYRINRDRRLIPLLSTFPFKSQNLNLLIFFKGFEGKYIRAQCIESVSLQNEKVLFCFHDVRGREPERKYENFSESVALMSRLKNLKEVQGKESDCHKDRQETFLKKVSSSNEAFFKEQKERAARKKIEAEPAKTADAVEEEEELSANSIPNSIQSWFPSSLNKKNNQVRLIEYIEAPTTSLIEEPKVSYISEKQARGEVKKSSMPAREGRYQGNALPTLTIDDALAQAIESPRYYREELPSNWLPEEQNKDHFLIREQRQLPEVWVAERIELGNAAVSEAKSLYVAKEGESQKEEVLAALNNTAIDEMMLAQAQSLMANPAYQKELPSDWFASAEKEGESEESKAFANLPSFCPMQLPSDLSPSPHQNALALNSVILSPVPLEDEALPTTELPSSVPAEIPAEVQAEGEDKEAPLPSLDEKARREEASLPTIPSASKEMWQSQREPAAPSTEEEAQKTDSPISSSPLASKQAAEILPHWRDDHLVAPDQLHWDGKLVESRSGEEEPLVSDIVAEVKKDEKKDEALSKEKKGKRGENSEEEGKACSRGSKEQKKINAQEVNSQEVNPPAPVIKEAGKGEVSVLIRTQVKSR